MEIIVEVKSVYGQDKIYPINNAAQALARIAGKKTLSLDDLEDAHVYLKASIVEMNSQKISFATTRNN